MVKDISLGSEGGYSRNGVSVLDFILHHPLCCCRVGLAQEK